MLFSQVSKSWHNVPRETWPLSQRSFSTPVNSWVIYFVILFRIFVFHVASKKVSVRQGNRKKLQLEEILDQMGIEPIFSSILNGALTP